MQRRRGRRRTVARTWGKRLVRFGKGVGRVAKLARDVGYLRSVINVERKYSDTSGVVSSSTTPALILLNGLSQGTSATTRQGQSIKMVAIYPNIFWSINAAASTTYCRCIIFIDKQANGAAPAASDLLTTTTSVLSPFVIGNSKRFRVLMDIRRTLSLNGVEMVRFKKYKKISWHTEYNTGNAGTIADIQTNSLYMLHMSDQPTNTPTFAHITRMRFIDN